MKVLAIGLMGFVLACSSVRGTHEVVDFAHIQSGTRVHGSAGANPPPNDVRAAIGEGEHLSYPEPLPNWFVLDLGQERDIASIEAQWRSSERPHRIAVHLGTTPETTDWSATFTGVGERGDFWYHILEKPVAARFVRFECLELESKARWTFVNRFSLYGTSRVPRLVAELGERYGQMQRRMQEFEARAEALWGAPPEGWRKVAGTLADFCDSLAGEKPISEARWQELEDAWVPLLKSLHTLEAEISFVEAAAATKEQVFSLAAVDPMTRVFRKVAPRGENQVALDAARREWESGQVAVTAFKELWQVMVSWEPLRGPVVLGPEALDVQLVAFVKTKQSPVMTEHIGWWPDGLSPMAPFDLPAGQVQPLWITVKVPEDAPAGVYETQLTVQPEGQAAQHLAMRIQVRDFSLPVGPSLRNVVTLAQRIVEGWYRSPAIWDETRQDYMNFWMDRRLNPTSLYGAMIPRLEHLDEALARGMNTFVMEWIYSPRSRGDDAFFEQQLQRLAVWEKHLRERGLFDRAVVYLADEPSANRRVVAEVNRRARAVAERFPDMKRMLVFHRAIGEDFTGAADIWVPIVEHNDLEEARRRQAAGEEAWWYTVGDFFLLDRPLIESRYMPWLTWKYDLDGLLYWSLQAGWRGVNSQRRFSPQPGEVMWEAWNPAGHAGRNGIGNLTYPGPDGRPFSSIRLEMFREGMEDYEYFVLLRHLITQAEAHGLPDEVLERARQVLDAVNMVKDSVTPPPGYGKVLMEHRAALADAIETLQLLISEVEP